MGGQLLQGLPLLEAELDDKCILLHLQPIPARPVFSAPALCVASEFAKTICHTSSPPDHQEFKQTIKVGTKLMHGSLSPIKIAHC